MTEKIKTIENKTYDEFKAEAQHHHPAVVGQNNVVIKMPAEKWGLVWFGDIHAGAKYMLRKKFMEDWETAIDHPHVAIALGGDLIDNFDKFGHGGGIHEEDMPIMEQRAFIRRCIERNPDRVFWILQGNHEEWSYTADAFDAASYFAHHIHGYWLGMGGIVTLRFPKWHPRIYSTHKTDRRSPNSPVYGLLQTYFSMESFDLGLSAHWHIPSIDVQYIRGKRVVFGTCGSYKTDRYLASFGYKTAMPYMPGFLFDPGAKRITPFLDFHEMLPYL